MSSAHQSSIVPYSRFEQLAEGRSILQQASETLATLAKKLEANFCDAVELLNSCKGSVIVTGMGKAGLIGQKIAATLSSTGTRAHFLHPAEAVHGDLGCLHADDVVLALSNSGETEEVGRLLPIFRQMGLPIVAITAHERSTLGSAAEITLALGQIREAGPYGLAPSTSTTAMLAMGDTLALVVSRLKGFSPKQFAVLHPAGSLGLKLKSVREIMRHGLELRIARHNEIIREMLKAHKHPGRRTGAVIVVDERDRIAGLFTDSDLVRLLEEHREGQLDRPVSEAMTQRPMTIDADATVEEAVHVLSTRKFSELPVVDADGKPIGLIDITDVISLMPQEATE
ncbi:MAG: KpsF/GutQ family sugar-phosphate isomerase [Planctomycetaceae bacterium]